MESTEISVMICLQAWEANIKRTGDLINGLSDEQLMGSIAPGKNRGIYLFGHLVAVHDAMNKILGLGDRSLEKLDAAFLSNPDSVSADMPSISDLRKYWNDTNATLEARFGKLSSTDWLKKHEQMTEEDYAKDPKRCKLAVLISRTNHLSYHFGQMILLKK